MNTDTGQIYRGPDAIAAARARGEPIAEVSERVAAAVQLGMNRAERRAQRFGRPVGRTKNRQRSRKVAGRL